MHTNKRRSTARAAKVSGAEVKHMQKFLLAFIVLMPAALCAAQTPHRSGTVHTPDVDLHYEYARCARR